MHHLVYFNLWFYIDFSILKCIILEVDKLKNPQLYEKYTKSKSKELKMNADKYNFFDTGYNQGK